MSNHLDGRFPSDMQWLGGAPSHWEVRPLKRDFGIFGGSTPKSEVPDFWDGDIAWVTPAEIPNNGIGRVDGSVRTITQAGLDSCSASLVPAGSVVISTRAPIGSIAITNIELCTNQGCKSLVAKADADPRYYAYLLSAAKSTLQIRGKGTTFLELSGEELRSMRFPVPEPEVQTAIAAFLDRETAKIDDLVAEQKRLIELLKEKRQAVITHAVTKGLNPDAPMKDSGVEWLGEVPAHWSVCALSYRYDVSLGKMLDEKKITGEFLGSYLRNIDIQWGSINTEDLPAMDFQPHEFERYRLKKGDLIVCEGGEVGRCAIWDKDNEPCFYQKALHRLRPKSERDVPKFFFYLMRAAVGRGAFSSGENKATIAHLPAERFRRCSFNFPLRTEQEAIAEFLDNESSKIDSLVVEAECAIGLLKERRTALISSAVTGKIDVRDYAAGALENA